MDHVMRLVDGDEASLERRVAALLATLPAGSRAAYFTYWYTSRPPVHEATVQPAPRAA
ncbi:MAG: hypothetical protein HZB46_10260 [Solirubrobacterales bacterium]|nr:hypothetical protein [Solirubrobacterales bacterium]